VEGRIETAVPGPGAARWRGGGLGVAEGIFVRRKNCC